MSERVIQAADLNHIERNLNILSNNISVVSQQVDSVQTDVAAVTSKVEQMYQEFTEFVYKDGMVKQLQLAETRLVKVRQELENKYGHYDEVRRRTTGILQAVDISVVRTETINNATEELMLAAPKYWLAPCLIALSAWISDNKDLAERAVREALRRDDEKASLFFALVSRRANRYGASESWLERYFSMQDPTMLEREMVVVIDAFACGLFGSDSQGMCSRQIRSWITELSEKVGFIEDQQQQWSMAIISKSQNPGEGKYVYLPKYSPTWSRLENSLRGAKLHNNIFEHFDNIFSGPLNPPLTIQAAVDELLEKLVVNFDDEELPLRREERVLNIIVEEQGNKSNAERRYALEQKGLDEKISFTQLLTNSAMHPETSHSSRATQRLSVALSRDWILKAYEDITAKNRAEVPLDVELSIEGWSGSSRDGSNERELLQSLSAHIENKKVQALAKLKLNLMHWFALLGGAGLGVMGLIDMSVLMIVLGLGGVVWFFTAKSGIRKGLQQTELDFAKLQEDSANILKAALAELVDWRNEFGKEDKEYNKVMQFLESISPEQHISMNYSNARAVFTSH